MAEEHEYAFDVKLAAVIRIKAESEEQARERLSEVIDATDCEKLKDTDTKLTEFSLWEDDVGGPNLFEVDGRCVE